MQCKSGVANGKCLPGKCSLLVQVWLFGFTIMKNFQMMCASQWFTSRISWGMSQIGF